MLNGDKERQARTNADSDKMPIDSTSSQHCTKPIVVGSQAKETPPSISEINKEIYEGAPLINGYPCVKRGRVEEVLSKYYPNYTTFTA